MSGLRVFLFGTVRVFNDGARDEVRIPRATQGLLAYLMLHSDRRHPREVLAELFWPELSEHRAKGALSTAVWRLRRVLGAPGSRFDYVVTAPTGEIQFNNESEYWLDAEVFQRRALALRRPLADGSDAIRSRFEAVVDLYTADLLQGFFDDWVIEERNRLRSLYFDGLVQLVADARARGDCDAALAYGRRAVTLEPLGEPMHRELMRLYAASGQRHLAVRQYESCKDLLASELGIQPMDETERLLAEIVASNGNGKRLTDERPKNSMQELEEATREFELARLRLQAALEAAAPGRLPVPAPNGDGHASYR